MTKRISLLVTYDTDLEEFVIDTDVVDAYLSDVQCWRGGWCCNDETERDVNEHVLVEGIARRESSSGINERSVESIIREDSTIQKNLPIEKLLLTVKEAGYVLSVSRSKVYELMNSGDLPSVYVGGSRRIRVSDAEAFAAGDQREY